MAGESAGAGAVDNEHAPPSSAEEAAALLGAAISFDAPMLSSSTAAGHANPPPGMHSIFTVQEPVPNQVLFVRLCNLRAWLRWHADALEDSPDRSDDSVSILHHAIVLVKIGICLTVSIESHNTNGLL